MRRRFPALLLILLWAACLSAPAAARAADDGPAVPPLAGRVVDLANMISPGARQKIAAISADLERTDSTQVVVLTVPSLKGQPLEDYSLRVAEAWGLGQKGKDNGVLILVARDERKVRIEVGYGLEGRLTDLLAGRIVDNVITPRFKAGDFDGGFVAGADAVAKAVRGEFKADKTKGRHGGGGFSPLGLLLFFIVLGPLGLIGRFARPRGPLERRRRGGFWIGGGPFGGGGFGGGGFGGGFGGGGGGFGGGGASGGW